jgi:hypothetical protein
MCLGFASPVGDDCSADIRARDASRRPSLAAGAWRHEIGYGTEIYSFELWQRYLIYCLALSALSGNGAHW